jgi:hypothetical protein
MAALVIAYLVSAGFLSFIPYINWLCLIGFTFAVAAWVLGRKIRQTDPTARYPALTMALGIAGTFTNLLAILFAFVLGGLLMGGFVMF